MTSKVQLLCVPPDMVEHMAGIAHDLLERGLATAPEHSFAEHIERARAGSAQLWVAVRSNKVLAAFLTEIHKGPSARFVDVYGLGGVNVSIWRDAMREALVSFAAEEGCDCIRFAGRAAWGRIFRDCKLIQERDGQAIFERAAA